MDMKFRQNRYKRVKWIDSRYGIRDYLKRKFFYSAMIASTTAAVGAQIAAMRAASSFDRLSKAAAMAGAAVAGHGAIAEAAKEYRGRFRLDYKPAKYATRR